MHVVGTLIADADIIWIYKVEYIEIGGLNIIMHKYMIESMGLLSKL